MRHKTTILSITIFTIIVFFSCQLPDNADGKKSQLENEAKTEAFKILNQYYLIENDNWYTCRMKTKTDWNTKTTKRTIEYFRQYRNIHTQLDIKEITKADKLNGIEFRCDFYVGADLTRIARPDDLSNSRLSWYQWFDKSILKFAEISMRKEKGQWIIEESGERDLILYSFKEYYKKPLSSEVSNIVTNN